MPPRSCVSLQRLAARQNSSASLAPVKSQTRSIKLPAGGILSGPGSFKAKEIPRRSHPDSDSTPEAESGCSSDETSEQGGPNHQ
ncbi:hypothetical protein EYF80_016268 [Liparis tanakae]|uniref:Uncharacterized protein n=1 Tax=Liparis tanakae TaxID=230148 RepID=A0A4Z2I6A6_9TELE|nr:hypothetical protein EYF80_016268 [Liparis tanakae]